METHFYIHLKCQCQGATGPRTQVIDLVSSNDSVKVQTIGYGIMQEKYLGKILSIQIKCWLTVITVFNLLYNEIINYVMPAAPRHGRVRWAKVTFANIASSDWPAVSRDHTASSDWLMIITGRTRSPWPCPGPSPASAGSPASTGRTLRKNVFRTEPNFNQLDKKIISPFLCILVLSSLNF